jgi:diguanylate cyclase (GGDEF)-like protein
MLDIDHFKEINDTYGHPVGDHILKQLARIVEHEARGYDVFARYGGEEFVFLMRGGSRTSAQALADRVHRVVEGHTFTCENIELKVTVSVGASFWGGEDTLQRPAELVELTDKLLYEAKARGRNCIRYDSIA